MRGWAHEGHSFQQRVEEILSMTLLLSRDSDLTQELREGDLWEGEDTVTFIPVHSAYQLRELQGMLVQTNNAHAGPLLFWCVYTLPLSPKVLVPPHTPCAVLDIGSSPHMWHLTS